MAATGRSEYCPKCRNVVPETERHCPACMYDLGAPNVREIASSKEVAALRKRAFAEFEVAKKRGYSRSIQDFSDSVKKKSAVVVSMPAAVARRLVSDPRMVFEGYEELVGAGRRTAADRVNDRHRVGVSGLLFGTYGSKIRYGVLSLMTRGLRAYGDVACRMQNVAIQDRVSFLECNSYGFVEAHKLRPGTPIPEGYRAVWNNRHLLAVAKLGSRIVGGGGEEDWQNLLLLDAFDRKVDDFIEAHIYESFTVNAVEEMVALPGRSRDKDVLLDVDIALEKFANIKRQRR